MAVGDEDPLVLVHCAHADLDQGSISRAAGHVVGHDLQHIADLHSQQIQHAGVKSLGFEVLVGALLSGMGGSEKLYDLFLQIVEALLEVLQALGLAADDGLVHGRVYQDLVAHVELHVAELINAPVIEMPAVSRVRAAAHEAGDQNDLAAGSCLIYAAGSALVSCQVARAVGTKSTGIVSRCIHDPVSVCEHLIPLSERCHARLGERTHLLIPLLSLLNDSSDVDLDVLHVLNRKAALFCCHRNLSLLFL